MCKLSIELEGNSEYQKSLEDLRAAGGYHLRAGRTSPHRGSVSIIKQPVELEMLVTKHDGADNQPDM